MSRRGPLTHTVVRATSWSDGGADFIYADGTILSFVDDMNTFAAVAPMGNTASACSAPSRYHCHTSHTGTTASPCAQIDREMCFTAWTLSRYEAKVRAALEIYNSLSERPRLLTNLLPEPHAIDSHRTERVGSYQPWRAAGPPIQALLMEKRADLFTRYRVYGVVSDWLLHPALPVTSTGTAATATTNDLTTDQPPVSLSSVTVSTDSREATAFSIHQLPRPSSVSDRVMDAEGMLDGENRARPAPPPLSRARVVQVGTVLELWCALRRVCLTVDVHRKVFTVRWPAPVTRPDGSRLPETRLSATAIYHNGDSRHHLNGLGTASSSRDHASATLFTVVEQTFPVCDPPRQWKIMLQMALELDAELSSDVCNSTRDEVGAGMPVEEEQEGTSAAYDHDLEGEAVYGGCGGSSDGEGWLGELPEPQHWGGSLNGHRTTDPCRFSQITVEQAAHIAAPRTTRALAAMRALHNTTGTRLLWLYEASGSPAVLWCVPAHGDTNRPTTDLDVPVGDARSCTGNSSMPLGSSVLAWVAEDGSVVQASLYGRGYTVSHHRLNEHHTSPRLYRLHADSVTLVGSRDLRLPPTVGPLRCCVPLHLYMAREHGMEREVEKMREAREGSEEEGVSPQISRQERSDLTNAAAIPRESCALEKENGRSNIQTITGRPDAGFLGPTPVRAVAVVDPASFCLAARDPELPVSQLLPVASLSVCPLLAHLTNPSSVVAFTGRKGLPPPVPVPLQHRLSHVDASQPSLYTPSVLTQHILENYQEIRHAAPRMASHNGRYLALVADMCVQLSQLNCAVSRASSTTHIDQPAMQRGLKRSVYCPPLPVSVLGSEKDGGTEIATGDPVIYLTTRINGIGTFTALTNGTVRGHFEDRTIVTLIPGVQELDETQLLATCVYRDASRCTTRATQCTPGHPMFRYLAYLLPFRRFVFLRALGNGDGEGENEFSKGRSEDSTEGVPQCIDKERSVQAYSACSEEDLASPVQPSLLQESVGLLPSLHTSGVAASFAASLTTDDNGRELISVNRAVSTGEPLLISASPPARAPPTGTVRCGLVDSWGVTDSVCSLQSLRDRDVAELLERQERLESLLAEHNSLSEATRTLLRS